MEVAGAGGRDWMWQMFAAKARVVRVDGGSAVLGVCLDVQRSVLLSRLQV